MASSKWVHWTPGSGSLVVSFTSGDDVRSLWFPQLTIPRGDSLTATYSGGSYVSTQSGPERIPIPIDITSVTLSSTIPGSLYVFVSSTAYSGFKTLDEEGMREAGTVASVPADGSDTVHVPLSLPFAAIYSVELTVALGSDPTPTPPSLSAGYVTPPALDGFDLWVSGGVPGSTCTVSYTVNGV